MGIALLTLTALETFSRTGFYTALIQKKEEIDSYVDSAWTFTVLRGVILSGLLYCIAPVVADFFNVPEGKLIIQIIGISIFMDSLTSIGIVFFRKELQFNKLFIFQLTGNLADFTVAVSAALLLKNVWALVLGKLAGSLTRVIASYLLHPYTPRMKFDWSKARELFIYGKWILGSSIVMFLLNQGGDIVVGKLLGATILGFYGMAGRIPNLTAGELTGVIAATTFPAFSKLQMDISGLRRAYLKVIQLTSFIAFPVAGLSIFLAFDFTKIILGDKWLSIVPAMQILAGWGLLHSIGSASGPIFKAVGRPDLETKFQGLSMIILGILVYPLTKMWGMEGTALSVLLTVSIISPITFSFILRIIHCRFHEFIKMLLVPLFSILFAIAPLIVVKSRILKEANLFTFSFLIILGLALYMVAMQVVDYLTNYGLRALVYEHLSSLIKRV